MSFSFEINTYSNDWYQCPRNLWKHQFLSRISHDIIYISFFLFYPFRATNVAEDINNDDNLENIITSEFIIISSDEQTGVGNNVLASAVLSTTEKETENKKTSDSITIKDTHQG